MTGDGGPAATNPGLDPADAGGHSADPSTANIAIGRTRLGAAGPLVGRIGLGCAGMSGLYTPTDTGQGTADDREAVATLHAALDLGVTLLDTSDDYGPRLNEELIGRAVGAVPSLRERAVIATKGGIVRDNTGAMRLDGSPAHLRAACDASLTRLRTEVIDVYYLHRLDPRIPIEDTVGAMSDLVTAGKVRHIGLCEVDADTVRRAHAVHPLTAVQTEYSLIARDVEDTVLPTLRELGIALVAYSPLGRGLLTGTVRDSDALAESDFRRTIPRFAPDALPANLKLADALATLAADHGVTATQLALAWVLAQGNDIVPIPGTRRQARLVENIRAAEILLSAQDLAGLADTVDAQAVVGGRHSVRGARV